MRSIPCLAATGAAAAVVLCSAWAFAVTQPVAGAVALPDGTTLLLPFETGASVHITSGHGPNAGFSLHADTDATNKAMTTMHWTSPSTA